MTDGIIQQWLEKHYLEQLTAGITQELIEKIKQEAVPRMIKTNERFQFVELQKLIGDNQE